MTPRPTFLLVTLALLATAVSLALVFPSGHMSLPVERASWNCPSHLVVVSNDAVEDLTDFDPWLSVVSVTADPLHQELCIVGSMAVCRRMPSGLVHLRGPPA